MADNIENNPVVDYLEEKFGEVRVENGYYVGENDLEICYIPVDYIPGQSINVYASFPGDGGVDSNTALFSNIENGVYSDCAVFVGKSHTAVVNQEICAVDVLATATQFADSNNMNIANIGVECFSGSGGRGVDALANYIQTHDTSDTHMTLLWADAYTCTHSRPGISYNRHPESYKVLNEHGIPIYQYTYDGTQSAGDTLDVQKHLGIDVILIKSNVSGHGQIEQSAQQTRLAL